MQFIYYSPPTDTGVYGHLDQGCPLTREALERDDLSELDGQRRFRCYWFPRCRLEYSLAKEILKVEDCILKVRLSFTAQESSP